MIFTENEENFELEEDSFTLFDEMSVSNIENPLSMSEFMEIYSESDDLLNEVTNSFNEIDYDAILEYGLVNSFLTEAGTSSGGGVVSGITNAVKDKGTQIGKEMKGKPIATNIFSRMFNVIKNAFGVVSTFTENAITTFNINKLLNGVKSMPESVRYKTAKCFVDGAIDAIIEKIRKGMDKALKFISSLFVVGRMVDQKECKQHFDILEKVFHTANDLLLGEITADKQKMIAQINSLKNMFSKYSQIKMMQKSFLAATNAVNNPMKLVNLADKLSKTANNGQGITGGAGVAIDVTNKVMGKNNIMDIPGVRFVLNMACKMLGKGLSWFKKILTTCLTSLKAAYDDARFDKKNAYANKQYQKKMQAKGI